MTAVASTASLMMNDAAAGGCTQEPAGFWLAAVQSGQVQHVWAGACPHHGMQCMAQALIASSSTDEYTVRSREQEQLAV